MEVIKNIKPNTFKHSSLALGMFDGVHLGHQKVINNAIEQAKNLKTKSVVVTFKEHPQKITAKTPAKLISKLEDRLAMFEKLGVDATVLMEFNQELSNMTASDYIQKFLIGSLNAKNISIGYDHRFGSDKKGDENLLREYRHNFNTDVIPAFLVEGQIVSSSIIRKVLSLGEVHLAHKYLGRPFCIKGEVIKGAQRGRLLGYPTANIELPEKYISPRDGVYAGIVEVEDKQYKSVINIGKRPTYNDIEQHLLEAHLIDFKGDLYSKEINVLFIERIRDEVKFKSEEDLKTQIQKDYLKASCDIRLK